MKYIVRFESDFTPEGWDFVVMSGYSEEEVRDKFASTFTSSIIEVQEVEEPIGTAHLAYF